MFEQLSLHAGAPTQRTKLFISREDATTRRLKNEDELWQFLSEEGFQRVILSTHPYLEQIRLFASADSIVATHGAGLTNIGFCRRDASVLEISPDDYRNTCFRFLAIRMGLHHHIYRSGTLSDFIVDMPMFKTFFRNLRL